MVKWWSSLFLPLTAARNTIVPTDLYSSITYEKIWTIKSSVAKLSQLKSNLVLYLKGQHTCLRTLLPTESIKHMLEQSMITWCIYPKSLLPGFTLPFRDLILPPLLWRSVVLLLWLMSPEEPLLIVIDTLMCSLPLPEEVIGGWGSTWL